MPGATSNYGGDDNPTLKGDERIIHRARKRFLRCKEFYDRAYEWSLEDTKFANADDRNHAMWPDKIYADRTDKRKPCLTINIVKPHNRLVINEAMQNKMSIRIRATGGDATADAAEGMQALVDRTENISSANVAYRRVITHQVDGGIGWLLLRTRFLNDKSFDQDVYIEHAEDPRAVYLDPDAHNRTSDGSGADFGFVFNKMTRDEFNRDHRKFKDKVGTTVFGFDPIWVTDTHVLVADYYEREGKNDELIWFKNDDGTEFLGHRSEMEEQSGPDLVDQIIQQIDDGQIEGQYRDVVTQAVNWYLIGGDCIVKRGVDKKTRWIGSYIPIIPCYGDRIVLEGKLDLKGHTRCQISPNQMLNYNASGQVQFGALQSRSPYIGPARAFEANEKEWATANIEDYAYLPYDDWVQEEGEEGRALAKPERQEPPQVAPAFMQGMQDAEKWNMMVTGQFQSQLGQAENVQSAASGVAVQLRQRQGNIATLHFTEHQNDMFRLLGKMLIDIYPKLYDTKRVLHVEGEDMKKRVVTIDPDAAEAFQKTKKEADAAEEIIFNPDVGEYEVISDPGPAYATQRQETFAALSEMFSRNMALAGIIGDIYFKNGDFAGAQEMADRVRKEIRATKPYLFDDNARPEMVQMQQQLQKLTALNGELMQKLADLNLRLRGKQELRDVEAFNAETKRTDAEIKRMDVMLKFLMSNTLSPDKRADLQNEVMRMDHELNIGAREHVYRTIERANAGTVEESSDNESYSPSDDFDPASIGATKAPDGNHYLRDPARPGKYLRVVH